MNNQSWILWVDGVGGYLLCLGETVTLGQAFAEPAADVALLADVSRHHATVRRDGEGYWLESERSIALNQIPAKRSLLKTGDRITLGDSCQLLFHHPEPLSATARLTPISGHRFAHPVDAALLMAETLTLGPASQAHIVVPDLTRRVVIHRQGEGLAIKTTGSVKVGGRTHDDRADLAPGSSATVEELTFTLEAIP